MDTNSKIYVAGHTGLVGSAIVRKLEEQGYKTLVVRTHEELDLTDAQAVKEFFEFEKPEYVFLAAARVGGILGNSRYPVEFMLENLKIQNNIIENSYKTGVKKLLFLGSSCIYPKITAQPISEPQLLSGQPEPTNEGYALAKICGIKLCNAYNKEYGTNYLSVMPCNLYGINDTYDEENSHVIPMLIRRFHQAKVFRQNSVTVWGSGNQLREFLYADDLAEVLVLLMEAYNAADIGEWINVGSGTEISIKELAETIKDVIGYSGEIIFDTTKPEGVNRKLLDNTKISRITQIRRTNLKTGLVAAYADFCKLGS